MTDAHSIILQLWKQGNDTVSITRMLNLMLRSQGGASAFWTEAEVQRALNRIRERERVS